MIPAPDGDMKLAPNYIPLDMYEKPELLIETNLILVRASR